MQNIYFGAVFAAIMVYLLAALVLFMQRKKGERSRTILAAMTGLSVLNYVGMMVFFYMDPTYGSGTVMDVPFLLIGIFLLPYTIRTLLRSFRRGGLRGGDS